MIARVLGCLMLIACGAVQAAMPPERLAAFRADLAFLAEQLPQRHAGLYHTTPAETFQRVQAEIDAALPGLDEPTAIAELARYVALARDGHTALFLLPFPGAAPIPGIDQFPLQLFRFGDGYRVVAIDPQHAGFLGARLVGVGERSIDSLEAAIARYVPRDNRMGEQEYVAWYLALPAILAAIGVEPEFTFEVAGQRRVLRFEHSIRPDSGWAQQWVHVPMAGFASALAKTSPLWLSQPTSPYWFTRRDNGDVYAQINLLREAPTQSFAAFVDAALASLPESGSSRLIIDLRLNRGGNGDLIWALIHGLIRHDGLHGGGRLFVITSRRTFSAAQMLLNALERHTDAVFVGEPSGSSPNHFGELDTLVLPATGLPVLVSRYFYQHHPADRREFTAPHLQAELGYDDLQSGHDPALEVIDRAGPLPDVVAILESVLADGDRAAARRTFLAATAAWRNPYRNTFEASLNGFGYRLLAQRRVAHAVVVLQLAAELYPHSANAWDSLGEAHVAAGNRHRAAYCYARSLRLDPGNAHGEQQLLKLLDP